MSVECCCQCGNARFKLHQQPFIRFYCHCLICQRIYQQPYADVSVVWASGLEPAAKNTIHTARYKLPPALARSTCVVCKRPVHGLFKMGRAALAFVPSANVGAAVDLPAPSAHLFYHRRAADLADDIPKFNGYWRSESAVIVSLGKAILRDGVSRFENYIQNK